MTVSDGMNFGLGFCVGVLIFVCILMILLAIGDIVQKFMSQD